MPPHQQPRGAGAPPQRGRGGRGGRGGARGGSAQPAHQAPPSHISTVGVRRPDYGSSGRPVTINVNSFKAEVPDGSIYHYDGVISTEKNFPLQMNMRIIKALQDHVAPNIFADTRVVFDGRKNLFAPVELKLGGPSREFDVTLSAAPSNPDRPPRIYKVRLAYAAKINTEILHRFIAGQQSQDNTVSTALMALNVVIRMEPSQRFPTKGRSFFTSDGARPIGAGLVLWRGYFQSIRPAMGRMLINVDISTGVMYQSGRLIDVCMSFLGINNPNMLTATMPDRQRLALGRFISGVRVHTRAAAQVAAGAAGDQGTPRVIRKLSTQGANQVTFVLRGGQIKTVAQYFQETSGRPLQFPGLLCVEVGQGALIPLELCAVLPGQLVRKEIPEDKKTQLVEFATMRPKERLESIKKGLQVLAYGQSEYVRKFGLTVDPTLLTTQARVLNAPTLQYGSTGNPRAATVSPRNGSWNMADKRFFRTTEIKAWVFIIFESMNRFGDQVAQTVATDFVKGIRTTGIIVVDPNPIVRRVNGQGDIPRDLQAAGAECFAKKKVAPTLFVVVLPEGGNDIYTIVKHWGDVSRGVATQCLKSRKCTGAKIQFWANVALKINVKLGGINVIPDPSQVGILSDPHNPTVVMGADVMHPGAGTTGRPSFAAVVSSVDSYAAKYVADQCVQASRQELITDLKEMSVYLLGKYISYREHVEKVQPSLRAPKRLIFYRDGVSEGQFQQVLDQELPLIKAACRELKINPTITLVVVGKRHHVRLFPTNERDADRSGNLPAGTVVDRDIGHPTEFDFYLQSHGGLLGTSRPAHYSVLYDENHLTADTMQALSFALCHVYAGSTRSVSIPAPVYYADTVCARAKIHFDPTSRQEWSDSGATDVSENLEAFKNRYLPLHADQRSRMYFSVRVSCFIVSDATDSRS
ncbi:argonaute-like protein [Mycena maculata]|uniref:Argonaute-like protein n=1 Tax=Mycena maculata TaxID=230809 RepID=A0AAD7I0Z1_9AGAR|nr:argonaute-like protein [Mycena maculata]